MVAHTCNPSTQEAEAGLCEFEASLGCLVNSRPVELWLGPVSIKEEKTKPSVV